MSEPANTTQKGYQNHFLVALILLLFGTSIAMIQFKVPTIMPNIMQTFNMDAGAASWLMSIFTFVGIILALPTGALAKKFGPKTMLLAAAGIIAVGSLIGAFAGSGMMLIVSRAIEGLAFIFVTICGPLAVQKYVAPEKLGSATGIWALWVCLGSVFGGVVTPGLYNMTGFQGVWIGYAALAVITAIVVALLIKEPGRALADSVEDATANVQAATAEEPGVGALLNKDTALFFLGFAVFNLVLMAVLAFSPTWMQINNIDPTLSGFISTLPMLLAVISSPLFGSLSDKMHKTKPLLLLAMVVMGPCAFVMLTMTGAPLWLAAIVMGLIGLGGPVMYLTAFPTLLSNPSLMSIGMGFLMLVQSLGQFLGTWITPLLLGADMSQWTTAGIAIMIIGLAGTGLVALAKFK